MNEPLETLALLVAIALPGFAQQGRLSSDEQREFDKYYTKWVNDTRKNHRDDIAKDVKHMQEIMGRNGTRPMCPMSRSPVRGGAYPARSYQGRLSAHDQGEFDKYYTKWVNDTGKNDRDDMAKDVAHMLEISGPQQHPRQQPVRSNRIRGCSTTLTVGRGNWRCRCLHLRFTART